MCRGSKRGAQCPAHCRRMLHGRGVRVHGHQTIPVPRVTGAAVRWRAPGLRFELGVLLGLVRVEPGFQPLQIARSARRRARPLEPGAPGPGAASGHALVACSASGMPSIRQPWGLAVGSTLSTATRAAYPVLPALSGCLSVVHVMRGFLPALHDCLFLHGAAAAVAAPCVRRPGSEWGMHAHQHAI